MPHSSVHFLCFFAAIRGGEDTIPTTTPPLFVLKIDAAHIGFECFRHSLNQQHDANDNGSHEASRHPRRWLIGRSALPSTEPPQKCQAIGDQKYDDCDDVNHMNETLSDESSEDETFNRS